MKITIEAKTAKLSIVRLDGALNKQTEEKTKKAFKDLADQGVKRVILDLAQTSFIDSSGLTILVYGLRQFGSEPGNFLLVAPQSQPRLLFELTMMADRVFLICDTMDEALAKMDGGERD